MWTCRVTAREKLTLLILVQEICPVGVLDEEIRIETAEKFLGAPEIRSLMGVAQKRERIRAEAQKWTRHPSDSASETNGGRSRVAGEEFVTAGTAQCDGDVFTSFLGELIHQISTSDWRRADRKFNEVKHFDKIGKF